MIFGIIELHDKLCNFEFCISHKISSKGRIKDKHSRFVKSALKTKKAFIPIHLFASEAESSSKLASNYRPSAFHMFFSEFFNEMINKFNKETTLCLCVAWFEYKLRSHPFVSLQLLSLAEKQKPSLFYQYEISHLRWLIEGSLLEAQRKALQITSNKLTALNILTYVEESTKSLDMIEDATAIALDLWRILLNESLSPNAISERGRKLMILERKIGKSVKKAQEANPNNLGFIFKYSVFLKIVLHFEKRAYDTLGDIRTRYQRIHIMQKTGLSGHQIDDDAAIFRVSGDREKMGKILDCTYNVKELGMERSELVGRVIQSIMPPNISDHHNNFIKNFLNSLNTKRIRKNTTAFAKTANDTFLPVKLYVIISPYIGSGIEFVGFISRRPQCVEIFNRKINTMNKPTYLLLNKDKRVIGVSEGAVKLFYISARFLKEQANVQITLYTIFESQSQNAKFESDISREEGKIMNFDFKHLKEMFSAEIKEELSDNKHNEDEDDVTSVPTNIDLWLQMKKEELGSEEESEDTLYILTAVPLAKEEKALFDTIISGDVTTVMSKNDNTTDQNQPIDMREIKMDDEVTSTMVEEQSISSDTRSSIQIKHSLDQQEEPDAIKQFRFFAAISQGFILMLIICSFIYTYIQITILVANTKLMFDFSERIVEISRMFGGFSLLYFSYFPTNTIAPTNSLFESNLKWIIFNAVNNSHDSQSEIQLVRSSLDDQIAEIEDGIFKARAYEYNNANTNNIDFYDYDQTLNVLVIELLSKSRRILGFSYKEIYSSYKDISKLPGLYLSLSEFLFYNVFNFSRIKLEKEMALLYNLRVEGISGKITGLYIMYSIALFISLIFCIIILARAVVVVKQKALGLVVFSFIQPKEIRQIVAKLSETNLKTLEFQAKYIKDTSELLKVFCVTGERKKNQEEDDIEKIEREPVEEMKKNEPIKTDSNPSDESSIILLNKKNTSDKGNKLKTEKTSKSKELEEGATEIMRQKKRESQLFKIKYSDICSACVITILSTLIVIISLIALIILAYFMNSITQQSNTLSELITNRREFLNMEIATLIGCRRAIESKDDANLNSFLNIFKNYYNQSLILEQQLQTFTQESSFFFQDTQNTIIGLNSKEFCLNLKHNLNDYALTICKDNKNTSSLGLRNIIYKELTEFDKTRMIAVGNNINLIDTELRSFHYEYHIVVSDVGLTKIMNQVEIDTDNFYHIFRIVQISLVAAYSVIMFLLYFVAYRYVIGKLSEEIMLSKTLLNMIPIDFISNNDPLQTAFNKNSKI